MCHLKIMFGYSRVVGTPNNHDLHKLGLVYLEISSSSLCGRSGISQSPFIFLFCHP